MQLPELTVPAFEEIYPKGSMVVAQMLPGSAFQFLFAQEGPAAGRQITQDGKMNGLEFFRYGSHRILILVSSECENLVNKAVVAPGKDFQTDSRISVKIRLV